ncbi:MAG: ComEC/Rec2 family competence protein, partial [Verrucomicrobiota bacterium]
VDFERAGRVLAGVTCVIMASRSTGHRAPLLWLVVPGMLGLTLAHIGLPGIAGAWLAVATGCLLVIAILTARRGTWIWAGTLCAAMILIGMLYGQSRWRGVPERADLPSREARLEVRVARVFAVDETDRSIGLGEVGGTDAHLAELRGQRIYWAMDAAAPVRGEVVELLGVLTPLPADPEAESFDSFLENAGVTFSLRRAERLGTVRAAPAYYQWCERMRARFAQILGLGLEDRPELAGVVRAMALGQKAELDDGQETLFRESGTMHLFAISGLHIGVIAGVFELLLVLTRMPAWLRFWIGTALLWLYVDITGAPPSAVRAFIMVAFVHAAWRWRAPGNALAALAAAALVVLVIAPEQMFSASFQLSYGIVAALLMLGLPLMERLKERWALFEALPRAAWSRAHRAVNASWRALLDGVSLGVAAALVGILGGVAFFGVLTPGAFVANLVLVPLASLTLMAAVGAMLTGLVGATWLTVVFNHAAALLAWLMQALVETGMRVPGMSFPANLRWPELGPLTIAGTVALIALGYARKWSPTRAGLLVPLAWVLAVLIFGVRLE